MFCESDMTYTQFVLPYLNSGLLLIIAAIIIAFLVLMVIGRWLLLESSPTSHRLCARSCVAMVMSVAEIYLLWFASILAIDHSLRAVRLLPSINIIRVLSHSRSFVLPSLYRGGR